MRRPVFITVVLLLGVLIGTSSAIEVTLFDYTQYVRTDNAPNIYSGTFSGMPGQAKLFLRNGTKGGENRISSAIIKINGNQVLWPRDFNQQVYNVETPINLSENNSISIELRSVPGSYLSIQMTQQIEGGYVKPLDQSKVGIDPDTGLRVVSDQIIVVFKEGASADAISAILSNINGVIVGYLDCCDVYQIEIKPDPPIQYLTQIIAQLNADPNIHVATLNTVGKPQGIPDPIDPWCKQDDGGQNPCPQLSWDESSPSGRNWGLTAIYARSAWNITTGNPDNPTKVGILDTGLMIDHQDINLDQSHATGIGGQALSGTSKDDHGTHVTGIIGATSDNGMGITGIMWEKDLYFYKPDGTLIGILSGVQKLLQNKVKIVNISLSSVDWGGCVFGINCPSDDNSSDAAWLTQERNVTTIVMNQLTQKYGDFLIVQAAGNDGQDAKWTGLFATIQDQALKKRILVVASIGRPTGCPSSCSYRLSTIDSLGYYLETNWGSQVDIAAPGHNIFSTIANFPYYANKSGTSMAAPHVTGVAGLVWSANDSLTASQVKQILVDTADRSFVEDGWPYKILNAKAAVEKAFQPPSSGTWAKVYGGTGMDYASTIQQTFDGGYIVSGQTTSFGAGDYDLWALKLDANGSIQWQKAYGGTGVDYGRTIQQTSDGGYIVACLTNSFGSGQVEFWVLKLDASGNIQWQKAYGGTGLSYIPAARLTIQLTSEGGYIVLGGTYSSATRNENVLVLKLDASGNIQWQKAYGGDGVDYGDAIQQTSDGGYVLSGETTSFGAGDYDLWVLKLDASGNIQWQKTYGGAGMDLNSTTQQTSDGGYVVSGTTFSFGAGGISAWVLKLDASGNIQWQKTFRYTGWDLATAIQQTSEGGYIVSGESYSFSAGSYDGWILQLDANGEISFNPSSGAIISDTNVTPNDTSAINTITSVYDRDTNITPTNTLATVTDTNAVASQLAP